MKAELYANLNIEQIRKKEIIHLPSFSPIRPLQIHHNSERLNANSLGNPYSLSGLIPGSRAILYNIKVAYNITVNSTATLNRTTEQKAIQQR